MKILSREDRGLIIELGKTKRGNICLDTKEFEKVWRMSGQKDLVLYESINELIIKPLLGLLVQIDGECYRLVKVFRDGDKNQEKFNDLDIRGKQKNHFFTYSGLFVPSNKDTTREDVILIYEKSEIELERPMLAVETCEKMEELNLRDAEKTDEKKKGLIRTACEKIVKPFKSIGEKLFGKTGESL